MVCSIVLERFWCMGFVIFRAKSFASTFFILKSLCSPSPSMVYSGEIVGECIWTSLLLCEKGGFVWGKFWKFYSSYGLDSFNAFLICTRHLLMELWNYRLYYYLESLGNSIWVEINIKILFFFSKKIVFSVCIMYIYYYF